MILLPTLALAGLIAYYFFMLKPKQDEKAKQRSTKGAADIIPAEPDKYADIIDDYPTYHRQDGVK